jgi:nitrite reductase (NADH) small subunit
VNVLTEHEVAAVDEIPVGEGRAFAVDGTAFAVFRLRDGSVHAIQALCPHAGGPLADGQLDDCVVVCPLHSYAFELATGAPRSGPTPLVVYPARVQDGAVLVSLPG